MRITTDPFVVGDAYDDISEARRLLTAAVSVLENLHLPERLEREIEELEAARTVIYNAMPLLRRGLAKLDSDGGSPQ